MVDPGNVASGIYAYAPQVADLNLYQDDPYGFLTASYFGMDGNSTTPVWRLTITGQGLFSAAGDLLITFTYDPMRLPPTPGGFGTSLNSTFVQGVISNVESDLQPVSGGGLATSSALTIFNAYYNENNLAGTTFTFGAEVASDSSTTPEPGSFGILALGLAAVSIASRVGLLLYRAMSQDSQHRKDRAPTAGCCR